MDVRAELYRWLEDLPTWQQDLARRLSSTPQLDEGQYAEALNMVIAAFSDEPAKGAPQPRPITLDDLPQRSVRPAPRLVTLGRISGVGLLAEAETLNFAPTGLTVIYGANASGKSTYVRVLKRICRAVDRESEVLSNVFARIDQQNPVQDASIDILVGESKQSHEIDLADPKDVGTAAISVFDAKCAEMYVTQQNAVAYVPTELLLLTRLAATQDRMRADLATEAERLTGRRPDLTEFHADTAVKRALESVSASTDPADLEELATLDDAQAARIRELHAIISAAEWSSARADAQAARQDASLASELAQQIRAIERAVSTEAQNDLQSKAVAAETARAAAQAAAADFADLPLSGVGSEPWRLLWEAARSFVAQHGGTFPPVAEDACPLCLQTIASDTAETLTHFEAHVHSSVQERVNRTAAEAALELVAPDLLPICSRRCGRRSSPGWRTARPNSTPLSPVTSMTLVT